MRKIFLYALGFSFFQINAQEISIQDALRYGIENLNGSARFRGMGGAMGAVGADLSAININPAGGALFNNNQASLSLSNYNRTNSTNYNGTKTSELDSNLAINQLGAVFVFENKKNKSGWNKFTIGLNYENNGNLTDFVSTEGQSNQSISNYFLNKAQGIDISLLETMPNESVGELYTYLGENYGFDAQQAMLGYQAYLFDQNNNTPSNYFTNIPNGGAFYQKYRSETTGYNGKFTLNLASSYKNKFYGGMNLNFYFTDFLKTTNLNESNINTPFSDGYSVNRIEFNNQLSTTGGGFSLNLGGIYKISNSLRIGAAYQSPIWYRLNDELTQSLKSNYSFIDSDTNQRVFTSINATPFVANTYPSYRIQSPSKYTFSGAYIFKKIAILSIDYTLKDYSGLKFGPKNDYPQINLAMKNLLTNTYELNAGGEIRLKKWSVRGGYKFAQSPFINDYELGDSFAYSGGLGYTFGASRIDVSYTNTEQARTEALISSGMSNTSRIRTYGNNVTISYNINF